MSRAQTKKKVLKVEIYKVDDQIMMNNLDALEWHPRWYQRVPVKTIDWDIIEVYTMPIDKNTIESTEEYLESMYESEDENFIYYNWNRPWQQF